MADSRLLSAPATAMLDRAQIVPRLDDVLVPVARLGGDSDGMSFRAHDVTRDIDVVVKTFNVPHPQQVAERVVDESLVLARANIVGLAPTLDAGTEDDAVFL